MNHHSDTTDLEDFLDLVGGLEGAPDHVVDWAKRYGRTLLFHVKPSRRVSPAEAQDRAAAWLRRMVNRY